MTNFRRNLLIKVYIFKSRVYVGIPLLSYFSCSVLEPDFLKDGETGGMLMIVLLIGMAVGMFLNATDLFLAFSKLPLTSKNYIYFSIVPESFVVLLYTITQFIGDSGALPLLMLSVALFNLVIKSAGWMYLHSKKVI